MGPFVGAVLCMLIIPSDVGTHAPPRTYCVEESRYKAFETMTASI